MTPRYSCPSAFSNLEIPHDVVNWPTVDRWAPSLIFFPCGSYLAFLIFWIVAPRLWPLEGLMLKVINPQPHIHANLSKYHPNKACCMLLPPHGHIFFLCSPLGSSVHGDSAGENTGMGCHALFIFPLSAPKSLKLPTFICKHTSLPQCMCIGRRDRQLSEKNRQLITHSKMQQSRVPVPREQYDGSQTQNWDSESV